MYTYTYIYTRTRSRSPPNVQHFTSNVLLEMMMSVLRGLTKELLPSTLARGNINRDLFSYVRTYVRSSAQARTSRRRVYALARVYSMG